MKVLDKGHTYLLKDNGSCEHSNKLIFFKDKKYNKNGYEGTTNQEVLRALIDRMKFMDKQCPSKENKKIIKHLRKALALHEIRHIKRFVHKNLEIENVKITNCDDHFLISEREFKNDK